MQVLDLQEYKDHLNLLPTPQQRYIILLLAHNGQIRNQNEKVLVEALEKMDLEVASVSEEELAVQLMDENKSHPLDQPMGKHLCLSFVTS